MITIIHIQNKWEETFLFWMGKHESQNQEREKRMEKEKISSLPNHVRTTCIRHLIGNALTRRCKRHDCRAFFGSQRRSNMLLEHNPPTSHTQ